MKKLIFIIIFLIILLPAVGLATDYYVSAGGSNTSPYDTWAKASTTIGTINGLNPANGSHNIYLRPGDTMSDAILTLASWANTYTSVNIECIDGDSKTISSDGKFTFDANTTQPIQLNKSNIDALILKNFQVKGLDYSKGTFPDTYALIYLESVGDITIDGIDYNGHTGASTYNYKNFFIDIEDYVAGRDIEIKNCTWTNLRGNDDPTQWDDEGAYEEDWGAVDAHMLIINRVEDFESTSGSFSFHDNDVSNVYASHIMVKSVNFGAGNSNIYNNKFTNYGEAAIQSKGGDYFNTYLNEFSRGSYGIAGSGGPDCDINILEGNGPVYNYSRYWDIYQNYFHDSNFESLTIQKDGQNITVRENRFKSIDRVAWIIADDTIFENNVIIVDYSGTLGSTSAIFIYNDGSADDIIIRNNTFKQKDTNHTRIIYALIDDTQTGHKYVSNLFYMDDSGAIAAIEINDGAGGTINQASELPEMQYNGIYNINNVRRVALNTTYKNVDYDKDDQALWITDVTGTGTLFWNTGSPDVNNFAANELWPDDAGSNLIGAGDPSDSSADSLKYNSAWTPAISVVTFTPPAPPMGAYGWIEPGTNLGVSVQ